MAALLFPPPVRALYCSLGLVFGDNCGTAWALISQRPPTRMHIFKAGICSKYRACTIFFSFFTVGPKQEQQTVAKDRCAVWCPAHHTLFPALSKISSLRITLDMVSWEGRSLPKALGLLPIAQPDSSRATTRAKSRPSPMTKCYIPSRASQGPGL